MMLLRIVSLFGILKGRWGVLIQRVLLPKMGRGPYSTLWISWRLGILCAAPKTINILVHIPEVATESHTSDILQFCRLMYCRDCTAQESSVMPRKALKGVSRNRTAATRSCTCFWTAAMSYAKLMMDIAFYTIGKFYNGLCYNSF